MTLGVNEIGLTASGLRMSTLTRNEKVVSSILTGGSTT